MRSWVTNNDKLKQLFVDQGKYVDHGCELEKLLGSKYNPIKDSLLVFDISFDQNVITKRSVLSQITTILYFFSSCNSERQTPYA